MISRLLLALVLCLATQADVLFVFAKAKEEQQEARNRRPGTGKLRVRGETSDNNNIHGRNRNLFAERWSDPSNPQRGGAGAAAKGFEEVIPMRTAPTVSVPTMQTPQPVSVPPPTSTPEPLPPIPTPTPTQSPANRNDVCSRARPIQMSAEGLGVSGVILYEDTTTGAQIADAGTCNTITTTAPGVWFTVTGTGHIVFSSTCWFGTTYDTNMSVYSGSCNNLRCITANDDAGGNLGVCEINERASKVRWDTTAGETYYILVHGYLPTRFGDFQINFVSSAPLNNVCENTEDINVGDTIVGTTFQSDIPFSGDFNDNVSPQCPGPYLAPGVWYRIIGTGGTITADTCNPLTNYDTKLSIYDGSCSSRAACIAVNDNFQSPDLCSTVSWPTTSGREYYILVHGYSNGFLTSSGIFELSIR